VKAEAKEMGGDHARDDDILKKKIRKLDEIGSRFWKMMSLVSNIEIRSIQIP